jgi:hypothetical protein
MKAFQTFLLVTKYLSIDRITNRQRDRQGDRERLDRQTRFKDKQKNRQMGINAKGRQIGR